MLRIAPGIAADQIKEGFGIDWGDFALIGAAYYISYTPLQLLVGPIMDRYSPRPVLVCASWMVAGASLVSSFCHSFWVFLLCRFVLGIGSAFAWVGLLYMVGVWFPKRMMGKLIGLSNACGVLGGILGSGPFASLVEWIKWRETFLLFGGIGVVLALCIMWILQEDQAQGHASQGKETGPGEKESIGQHLKEVLRRPQTWIIGGVSLSMYLCISVLPELWAVSFLEKVHGFSVQKAAYINTLFYLGLMVASPCVGWLSDRISARQPILYAGTLCTVLCVSAFVFLPCRSAMASLLLFGLGMACSTQALTFSAAVEANDANKQGTALAANNFITMLGGIFAPLLIGLLAQNAQTTFDYRVSFAILPLFSILGTLLAMYMKETYGSTLGKTRT